MGQTTTNYLIPMGMAKIGRRCMWLAAMIVTVFCTCAARIMVLPVIAAMFESVVVDILVITLVISLAVTRKVK